MPAVILYQRGGNMSTVEEIVADIQSGADRKNELYTAIYKYLYQLCKKYLRFASAFGWEIDDLMSAAWVGVEKLIKDFDPDKGYKFITYLKFYTSNTIREFLGIRSGKKLQHNISLDEEMPGADGITYGDTIEDDSIMGMFEDAENADYYRTLLDEVDKLPQIQADTLKRHFLSNETLNGIATSRNVSRESVRQHERAALKALRRNKKLRDCYYEEFAYRNVGVTAFNNTWTSSTERAALKVIELANQNN